MLRKTLVTFTAVTALLGVMGFSNVLGHRAQNFYLTPPQPTLPAETESPIHGTPKPPAEDDPGFDCRTQGNRICGPGSSFPAGCYRDGVRVIPWTNYTDPKADRLYGQFTSPC